MFNISYAELNLLIAQFFWPFSRIAAYIASDPILGNRTVPVRVRVGTALLLTLCVAATLPPLPNVEVASAMGVWIMLQQIFIGLAMGFVVRVAFSTAELAGHLASGQMGLGFAAFFDPQHGTQVPVIGQFLGLIILLFFISINGHEVLIVTLAESFHRIPISSNPVSSSIAMLVVQWGSFLWQAGFMMAMPVIGALLLVNIALGIMTRAAPQLNIFGIGFPITLLVGFLILQFSVPYLSQIFAYEFSKTAETLVELLSIR